MRIIGSDGSAVLVDLERTTRSTGVPLGCTVETAANGRATIVTPALPLDKLAEAGLWDQPVDDTRAAAVRRKVEADPPAPPLWLDPPQPEKPT